MSKQPSSKLEKFPETQAANKGPFSTYTDRVPRNIAEAYRRLDN